MRRYFPLLFAILIFASFLCGCAQQETPVGLGNGWEPESSMQLDYASEFTVDYYAGGYKLITLGDGSRFLVIPENASLPKGVAKDIIPLYQPVENIYLAATATMCLFDALDRLDTIRLSSVREDAWHIENAKAAMHDGKILFAGKYSEPDYEMILHHACPLAIESTMIGHASEVKEKLEELGVAVLMDQSSNENHPLGRTEWIKLYGAILNEEEKAEKLFAEQKQYLNGANMQDTGSTVAFFYISSSGYVVAHKTGDYVTKMIDLAGGTYVFDELGDPEKRTSTVTMEMETFFAAAKEADYIIYNSTVGGEIQTIDDLIALNPILSGLKAVQTGNVWCTGKNMYQETTQLGQMIQSFHLIFSGQADDMDELPFLHRLH